MNLKSENSMFLIEVLLMRETKSQVPGSKKGDH
jgi:hypothetical protein